jgi:hypothetical protein
MVHTSSTLVLVLAALSAAVAAQSVELQERDDVALDARAPAWWV